MSNTPIELKGSSFTLSVVHLHDANPEVIRQALEDKIAQAPAFLRHAPVVVNIASIEEEVEWRAINEAIAATGLRIMGVSGCKIPRLKTEIDRAGIPLLTEGKEKASRPAPSEPTPPPPVASQITKTRLIDQPVRSGQRIYAPHCDLIVTNHVSAGAELILSLIHISEPTRLGMISYAVFCLKKKKTKKTKKKKTNKTKKKKQ